MMDYLELGPTPAGEDCEQLGPEYDRNKARAELATYCNQLRRTQESNLRIGVKSFPHDFGTYMEAVVHFDNDIEEQATQAYDIEDSLPEFWDDEAKAELAERMAELR